MSASLTFLLLLPGCCLAAVTSGRWRLVGRSAANSWIINRVGFYSDATCTTEIKSRPFRSHKGDGSRYDGSAFSGPNVRAPSGAPADAFEANGQTWNSGVTCPATGTSCHVGFRWLSDQVDTSGVSESFASVGLLQPGSAAPLCVRLDQSSQADQYATAVLVQYWSSTARSWQDHTLFSGLTGGTANLRLPEVPVSR
eukprot:TRINITY_DN47394_c0_g1_i1.p1 TRINITY_DN47394_c0_g1~~TRINITY_DN47394_c0_g1_i1.p1  ORF type:complete len:197 (+),score=14.65 TRINITY_DN47394_c0_g1_i1:103-693(+)